MPETTNDASSFESKLHDLQQIVQALEMGELPLAESIEQYEQGSRLLKDCYQILKQAELKVQQVIQLDDQGNPILEEMDSSSTAEQTKGTAGRRKTRKSTKKKAAPSEPEPEKGGLFDS